MEIDCLVRSTTALMSERCRGEQDPKETYRNIVIEEEQDPEDKTEGEGDAHPFCVQLPEPHQPVTAASRLEGFANRERGRISGIEATPVGHC